MEYKFRGKRIDNGEWVYGNFLNFEGMKDEFQCIIIPKSEDCGMYTKDEDVQPISNSDRQYLKEIGKTCFEIRDIGFEKYYKVDPNTVGQYIGMVDSEGKEIYTNSKLYHLTEMYIGELDMYYEILWQDTRYVVRGTNNNNQFEMFEFPFEESEVVDEV